VANFYEKMGFGQRSDGLKPGDRVWVDNQWSGKIVRQEGDKYVVKSDTGGQNELVHKTRVVKA
jgi:hypothetical protein